MNTFGNSLQLDGATFAGQVVQGWNYLVEWNVPDLILIPLVLFMVIGGVWSIVKHWKSL
jgi:hypothetical protein